MSISSYRSINAKKPGDLTRLSGRKFAGGSKRLIPAKFKGRTPSRPSKKCNAFARQKRPTPSASAGRIAGIGRFLSELRRGTLGGTVQAESGRRTESYCVQAGRPSVRDRLARVSRKMARCDLLFLSVPAAPDHMNVADNLCPHAIFLGAGASYSSGYPVGDGLRLRLACLNRFLEELKTGFPSHFKDNPVFLDVYNAHVKQFGKSIDLFRNGGFATVDEFSKLMSGSNPKDVQRMKKLMRSALLFHNPEDKFNESDYYAFIQRLFLEDNLEELRTDVSVISYNYDCYLDFLLLRAYECRQQYVDKRQMTTFFKNKLTSGFFHPYDLQWSEQPLGFNYYKLHG